MGKCFLGGWRRGRRQDIVPEMLLIAGVFVASFSPGAARGKEKETEESNYRRGRGRRNVTSA